MNIHMTDYSSRVQRGSRRLVRCNYSISHYPSTRANKLLSFDYPTAIFSLRNQRFSSSSKVLGSDSKCKAFDISVSSNNTQPNSNWLSTPYYAQAFTQLWSVSNWQSFSKKNHNTISIQLPRVSLSTPRSLKLSVTCDFLKVSDPINHSQVELLKGKASRYSCYFLKKNHK